MLMKLIERAIDRLVAWRDERRRARYIDAEAVARSKADAGRLTDDELVYAATARCKCGAGLAYPYGIGGCGYWDCSEILKGRAVHSGKPGAVQHTARLPFTFYEVKSERQPSARGATTRPSKAA